MHKRDQVIAGSIERLKEIFEFLHFELFQGEAHIDLTKDEINTLIEAFANDPSKLPRFVFVMSHGNEMGPLDVNGKMYKKMKVIFQHFNTKNAPHLEETLKFVAIQACR